MKALELYWFSGTGNTWLACQALSETLRSRGVRVTMHRLESTPAPQDLADDTVLGLAFPTACFSTYPLVWRFLEALPPGNGREAVALATMAGASGGMFGPIGRFLRSRGYHPVAARTFRMPSNYANRTTPLETNTGIVDRMRQDVAAFAEDLVGGRAQWPRGYPLWSTLLTRLARSPHPWRFFKNVFPLAVDPARCTRCGLCAELCPVGCIRMEDGPVWADSCESCQRCVGYCPERAIHVPGKPAEPYAAAPISTFRDTSL